MIKKIRFQTRFLSLKNQGIGRVSVDVYNTLKNDYNIKVYETKKSSNYAYLKHFLFDNFFNSRKYDIGIAMTNLDCFYLDPKKSLVIIHDLIPVTDAFSIQTHYSGGIAKQFILQLIFYYSLYKASKFKKIVFISEKTKEEFMRLFPNTPIKNTQVIYSKIQDKYKKSIRIKSNKFKIYYIGVLDHRKRTLELINAFKKIKNPNYELIIGGNGSILEKVKEISSEDQRIKLIGFVKDKDMVKNYNNCDVFIFPTKAEGFGLPIIEASLCYRPVITFIDGKIPDIVRKSSISIYEDKLEQTLMKLEKEKYWNHIANRCYSNSMKIIKIINKQKSINQLIKEIKW